MASTYKGKKKGAGRFVQLPEWLMNSEAWQTMKPGPRALYIELKRQFRGGNNGQLLLSHRDAAKALCVGRDTVGAYYAELTHRGFITITKGHCLGPSGMGQSATYALTEHPLEGAPATKDFMIWKKQNPRRKSLHFLAGKSDTPCRKILPLPNQMSENPAASGKKRPITVSENPAIYTFSHIPKGLQAFSERKDIIKFDGKENTKAKIKQALGLNARDQVKVAQQ